VTSIRVSFSERSYFEYTRMPSPIYQHVINLVVVLPIWRGPGVSINVLAQEHRALQSSVVYVAKFTILTSLSLLT
jgi:hypothetical protein